MTGVIGFVIGVAGFYTSFLDTYLKATVGFIDVVVLACLGLAVWRASRGSVRSVVGLLKEGDRRHHRWLRPLVFVLLVLSVLTANVIAFTPPKVAPIGGSVSCAYEAPAGLSIPIRPGGYLQQAFRLPGDALAISVSVIVGIDETISPGGRPHPVHLRLIGPRGHPDVSIRQDDIVNNRYTRFNLPTSKELDADAVYRLRLTNISEQPIGVYVKETGPSDLVDDPNGGVRIVGHLGSEAEYQRPGWAMSGCVETWAG